MLRSTLVAALAAILTLPGCAQTTQVPQFTISTVAGTGNPGYSGDGGTANTATLDNPLGVAVDAAGNLYIADCYNNRIRKVAANGVITTVAGTGSAGFGGDGGPAIEGTLYLPNFLLADAAGNLYVGDPGNLRVRKVAVGGTITTVAAMAWQVTAETVVRLQTLR
jgi:hypothetical protein